MVKKQVLNIALAVMTYNEAGNIPKLLSDTEKAAKNIKDVNFTMFVVDDSSPDGTGRVVLEEAKKIKASNFKVTLLTKSKKEGLGGAYIWGCEQILEDQSVDYICEMDADLSHNPKYLKEFVARAREGADLVVGSRYIRGGAIPDWSLKRKIMSVLGNLYVRFWLGSTFTDWSGGFNMYKAELLRKLDLGSLPKSYTFIITLKNRAQNITKAITEVPIVFMDRTVGESKIPSSYMREVLVSCPKLMAQNLKKKFTKENIKAKLPYLAVFSSLVSIITTCLLHFNTIYSLGNFNRSWRHYLLSDGDSLVIPLLFKSFFEQREAFGWVSSSQLFLFPEGVLYGISYILTKPFSQHFVVSLYLCGVLILLSVFALLYYIFKQVTSDDKLKSYIYALLVMSFITGTMLLEPYYNGSTSLSSFIMMSSYYPGSILCILWVVLATIVIVKKSPKKLEDFLRNRKLVALAGATVLIEAIAIACDPLCLLYVVVPMIVTVLFSYIVNAIKRTPALILIAIQVVSAALYFMIRNFVTSRYLTNDFSFNVSAVGEAVNYYLNGVLPEINEHIYAKIEWSFFVLFFVASVVIWLIALYRVSRSKNDTNNRYKLIMWTSLYAWLTIVGVAASNLAGRYATRYFLPLIILPPLSVFIYFAISNRRIVARISSIVLMICTIGFVCASVISVVKFNNGSFTSLGVDEDSVVCSLDFINRHSGHVASNSWFYVRALDLYDNDQRALPFGSDGTPYHWINNKYSYKDIKYNIFAIAIDQQAQDQSVEGALFQDMKNYEDMEECSGGAVKLYFYKTDSPEYDRLNLQIQTKTRERFGWE